MLPSHVALGWLVPLLATLSAAGPPPPPPPTTNPFAPRPCGAEDSICIVRAAPGASWLEHAHTTEAERKARGQGAPGTIKVTVAAERASLFINGRYVATTPFESTFTIPAGRNDLHLRSGRQALAKGVLVVPPGQTLELEVRAK